MNVNGVADTDTNEWSGHLAVKCPVAECRCFREPALLLNGEQIKSDGLWVSLADRRKEIGRFARNVSFNECLRHNHGRY
jgi:hypothetical protein